MATVLTLAPAFFPLMSSSGAPWLRGELYAGNDRHEVVYNNFDLSVGGVNSAVTALNTALHTYGGTKIIVGHSHGARIICKWLRDVGPTSDISSATVQFILTGNPERKYNGAVTLAAPGTVALYGGPGIPADTQYSVIDVARQYDVWADWPNDTSNADAVRNVNPAGLPAPLLGVGNPVHMDYSNVGVNDPTNVVVVEGNVSYRFAGPTFPMPAADQWYWSPAYRRQQDDLLRAGVERAYSRPKPPIKPPPLGTGATPGKPSHALTPSLAARLQSSDAYTAMEAATELSGLQNAPTTEIIVTVYDKFWKRVDEAGDRISLTAAKPRNEVPTAELVLKGRDSLVPVLRKCRREVVGITIELFDPATGHTAPFKWALTVDTTSLKFENAANNQRTLTAKCLGIYDILNYVLVWPNFLLPIQAQIPSHAWFIGNLCTVIETLISEQALRLQSGMWDLVNNLGSLNPDWRTWFGTWLASNGNLADMLHTPIYVVHTNPFFDTSPFVSITGRMETAKAMIDKLVKAYGVTVDMELWLPGDPQPDAWGNLKVPTYVVRVTDRSNVTGPTGTFLDGITKQIVNLEGSLMGDVLAPFLDPQNHGLNAPQGVNIAPLFGVDFITPWAVLVDPPEGVKGAMESFEIVDHHPQGFQLVLGGKSPKWMNDIINATFSWLIDSLMIVIGFTGVPSNLLDGLFNDVLLAFQLVMNFPRRIAGGPYMKPEKFLATESAPYNVDALFQFITFMWDTRGYTSAQATIRNGYPYSIGRDIFIGGLMSIISGGEVYTDYVENVMITDNRKDRAKVMVQIGDGKAEEASIAKTMRLITGLQESFNVVTLSA